MKRKSYGERERVNGNIKRKRNEMERAMGKVKDSLLGNPKNVVITEI